MTEATPVSPKLLILAARAYKAWSLRPHCGNGHHVLLCRVYQQALKIGDWDWELPECP